MGLFSAPNPFDGIVEKVTDAKNTSEDWGMIMDLCDQVHSHKNGAKDCLRAILKRLNHQDPHVVLQAITLLDACVNNCGKEFRLEVASREFENEFKRLLSRSQPKVQEKLRGVLKSWAEGEFKGDSQLSLITGLYSALKKEGVDFSSAASDQPKKTQSLPKDPNVVSSQQEEDDIAKAIQLSLQESKGHTSSSKTSTTTSSASLYPSASSLYGNAAAAAASTPISAPSNSSPKKEEKKARALYDFEAAEDNELTFKAGEVVIIIDDSDVNWWKGSNHRGEGLFPANFVSTDLNTDTEVPTERRRSVQFNEEVVVVSSHEAEEAEPMINEISDEKIDRVLSLLHEADPTSPETDAVELPGLEEHVNQMGPMIDAELEAVDRRHAQLTRLSTELVDALNLYHQLMHENMSAAAYGMAQQPPSMGYGNPYMGAIPPGAMPQQFNGYYPQPPHMPPQQHPNGVPSMMPGPGGYPTPPGGGPQPENGQMYASSAPPPPTPPPAAYEQTQQAPHFVSPPQTSVPQNFGMNGGQPVTVSGYNPLPQM